MAVSFVIAAICAASPAPLTSAQQSWQGTSQPPATQAQPPRRPRLADEPLLGFPEADGIVSDLLWDGSRLILGGSFQTLGEGRGSLLELEKNTLELGTKVPRVDGNVATAISDGSGGAFIAGHFRVDGLGSLRLARVRRDGTVEPFLPGFDGGISAMTWDRTTDTLYFVGAFEEVAGVQRRNAAAIHVGTEMVTAWDPPIFIQSLTLGPRAMIVAGGRVWIGGDEIGVFGPPGEQNLLVCDPVTGDVASHAFGVGDAVWSLASDGARVFVGGRFDDVAGVSRNRLAAFDATTLALESFAPNVEGDVFSLAVDGNDLFAGGRISAVDGLPRRLACCFDLTTGTVTGWSPPLGSSPSGTMTVQSFIVRPQTVLLGGTFVTSTTPRSHNVAVLDRSTGAAMGPGLALSASNQSPGVIQSLVQTPDFFLAAGFNQFTETVSRRYLAAIDTRTNEVDPNWRPNVAHTVAHLARNSDTVYAASRAFENPRITAFDRTTGDRKTGFVPDFDGIDLAYIEAIAVSDDALYVGGTRFWPSRYFIFALDPVTGDRLTTFPLLSEPTNVEALELSPDGSRLFVGGYFEQIGAVPEARKGVAVLDAMTGAVLPWQPAGMDSVSEIDVRGRTAFLNGYVNAPLFGLRNYAVAYDLVSGALLPWAPPIESVTTIGNASMTLTRGNVVIGGSFFSFDGAPASTLVEVDTRLGDGTGWRPLVRGTAHVLESSHRGVYVGGNFQGLEDRTRPCLMFFPYER